MESEANSLKSNDAPRDRLMDLVLILLIAADSIGAVAANYGPVTLPHPTEVTQTISEGK